MKGRPGPAIARVVVVCGCACVWALGPRPAEAGTTGKISGAVVDQKSRPIAGASVSIPAYRLGAATDADGRYTILNVPPGTCEVRFRMMGYRAVTVRDVLVSADNTTRQDATLSD